MAENKLYNIAYQHLMYRIRSGFYPRGSNLPTVPLLCMEFHVSNFTIHSAFKMLEKEQLVSLSQGRSAIVTYDAAPKECEAYFLNLLHATKDAIFDLQSFLMTIWPGVLLQGLRLCSDQDLDDMAQIADNFTLRESKILHDFFKRVLDKTGNSLISNFHLDTNLFMHEINCANKKIFSAYITKIKASLKNFITLRRMQAYPELYTALVELCQEQGNNIEQFYALLPPSPEPTEPIPYRWNYYRSRPQISFQIAMELLRSICSSYKRYDFIPSVRLLSLQYEVPVMTIRRAIDILNEIGITESINGKGTRVMVGDEVSIDLSRPSSLILKKALVPYMESVQFLLITCKDAARSVFPTLTGDARQQAAAQLKQIYKAGDYYRTFGVCLDLMIAGTSSLAFREVYGHLKYLLYLGYPLNDMKPNDFRYNDHSIVALIAGLEQGDTELFASELERLSLDIFTSGKEKLLAGGIHEAALIATPLLV